MIEVVNDRIVTYLEIVEEVAGSRDVCRDDSAGRCHKSLQEDLIKLVRGVGCGPISLRVLLCWDLVGGSWLSWAGIVRVVHVSGARVYVGDHRGNGNVCSFEPR